MTKTIPDYLRIHRGSESTSTLSSGSHPNAAEADPLSSFWNAYSDATGWRIDQRASRGNVGLELLPAVTSGAMEGVELESLAAVSKMAAIRLAESASGIAEELEANREAFRRQEAELASRAPILSSDSDRARIADRIERTLADAVAACGCDAAAMYLLDDDTQFLKARAVFGLSTKRLEKPPRPLSGSRGDLEALVQGVVTMNDLNAPQESWNCPEPFASGICAAVKSDDVPIGTLWLFRKEKADFGIAASAAARMAASQLSLELSQARREQQERKYVDQPVRDLSQWQFESLPVGAKLAEDWRADGMIESPRCWATGWHTWDVLPDGTLMLAIAEAEDSSAKGAMIAAIARAAFAAHTGYRHTPAQLIQRVSDTLWQTSTGEQLVSMLYARVDPESGEGEVASAGSMSAIIGSRFGYRPLVTGHSDPLNTYIDARCVTDSFRLSAGETLLGYNRGMVADGGSQTMLGEQVRSAMQSGESNPLALVRRAMVDLPLGHERGAVTLLRQ